MAKRASCNAVPGSIRPQETDDAGRLMWVIDCRDESDEEAQRAPVVGVRVASNTEPRPGAGASNVLSLWPMLEHWLT
jgi:hypothetical protein